MYMCDVYQQGKSVKVFDMYMSDVNQQKKSVRVAVFIYQMPIKKEKQLMLQYIYVR